MYRATQTSTEVRAFAARVLVGLEKLGIKRELVLDVMSEAGYVPSARTVRRHRGRARSGEDVLSPEKPSGRPPMLDEDEQEICAGFVLAQNLAHKDVHLEDYIRFVSENFGVKLSCSTASRYLELTGFNSRIVKSRASGYKWDVVAECKMMLNWVNAHREQFKGSREKMASIDFTYTRSQVKLAQHPPRHVGNSFQSLRSKHASAPSIFDWRVLCCNYNRMYSCFRLSCYIT